MEYFTTEYSPQNRGELPVRPLLQLAEPDPPPFETRASTEPAAHAAFFRHHRAWLLGLLKLRSRHDAEDLLQETFLRASAQDFSTIRHPRAWLATIALNVVREQHRRRAARAPASEADGAEALTDAYPAAGTQDEALLLKQIILALPPKLAEAFVLSRFEGLTHEEIARRCGVSKRTVEWRIGKALALCAARLKD